MRSSSHKVSRYFLLKALNRSTPGSIALWPRRNAISLGLTRHFAIFLYRPMKAPETSYLPSELVTHPILLPKSTYECYLERSSEENAVQPAMNFGKSRSIDEQAQVGNSSSLLAQGTHFDDGKGVSFNFISLNSLNDYKMVSGMRSATEMQNDHPIVRRTNSSNTCLYQEWLTGSLSTSCSHLSND